MSRSRLWEYWRRGRPIGIANPKPGELALRLKYRPDPADPDRIMVHWGRIEVIDCLGAWDELPPLRPLLGRTVAGEPPQT
jgi:hypothetical protein